MARVKLRLPDGKRLWTDFARRHRKEPFLGQNPLYAVPEDLINLIKNTIPKFWNPAEEEFERDLVRTAGAAFFTRGLSPARSSPLP